MFEKAKYIVVEAKVRYWEDAKVDGIIDTEDGKNIPHHCGDCWNPIIDLETGKIIDWPQVEADIYYKVCDEGEYFLVDGVTIKNRLKYNDEYVPSFLSIGKNGYGDYIIMTIGKDGYIKNWKKPELKEDEWHEVDYWKSL